MAPRARTLNPAAFCAVLLVGAAAAARFPMGSEADLTNLAAARFTRDPVLLVGNSVMRATSRCDVAPQTIAQLLAPRLERSIADRSFGGQTLHESIAYAASALDNPHVQQILVAVSAYQFHEWAEMAAPRALFFKLVTPSVEREPLAARLFTERTSPEGHAPSLAPFTYRSRAYPGYDAIKTRYFDVERRLMKCPETDGRDRAFLEAYYDHLYAQGTIDPRNVRALAALGAAAAAAHKRLVLALLPADYELMGGLRADLPAVVRQQVGRIVTTLRAQGLEVVDLSAGIENAAFADRWCACGHLAAPGRERVAEALAGALGGP